MFSLKLSALVVAATAIGRAVADDGGWYITPLDSTQTTDLAGYVSVLSSGPLVEAGLEDCLDICEGHDNCLGFFYDSDSGPSEGYCTTLKYDPTGFNAVAPGIDWIGWRLNTPTGPSCSSDFDFINSENGQCFCGDNRRQNTAFGCVAQALPSQAVRRRIMSRDHIMPGQRRQAYFM